MIRINLLPVRASKKRELGQQFLILLGLVLVITAGANWYWYSEQEKALEQIRARITDYEGKVATLNKIIGEVKNIKAEKAEMEQKLGILRKLRDGRTGPVKVMDELATIIPQRVWISSFEEVAGQLTMNGTATNLDEIANFYKKPQSSKFFADARLVRTSGDQSGERAQFTIQGRVNYSP